MEQLRNWCNMSTFKERFKDWCKKPVDWIQLNWYGKFLDSIGPMGRITFFGSIAIISMVTYLWNPLWDASKEEAKLQALASIFGNALGVFGAVLAVMLSIKYNEVKEKDLLHKIQRSIKVAFLHISIDIQNAADKLEKLQNSLSSSKREIIDHRLDVFLKSVRRIDLSVFENNMIHLHDIDEILPVAVNRAKSTKEELDRSLQDVSGDELLWIKKVHEEFKNYVREIIGIAALVDCHLPDDVVKEYASALQQVYWFNRKGLDG
jgi:hypothetical protein